MRHVFVRTAVVAGAAGALWLGLGSPAGARDDVKISTRLPYVPAEVLPPVEADPSSPVGVRVDPGDNEAPDPAPRLVLTLRSS
jgi:hypothetical protein